MKKFTRKFAWLPKRVSSGSIVWLENYYIEYLYKMTLPSYDGPSYTEPFKILQILSLREYHNYLRRLELNNSIYPYRGDY